jgi:phytanoyl-CoA hydroxylase
VREFLIVMGGAMALTQGIVLSDQQINRYHQDGYLLVERLLTSSEIAEMTKTFDDLHAQGSIPGCFSIGTPEEITQDPLQLYPRMMHPHRISPAAPASCSIPL